MTSCAGAAGAFLERLHQIEARGLPRGPDRSRQTGNGRHDERERVDAPVARTILVDRNVARRSEGLKRLARPAREQQRNDSGHRGEHEPLDDLQADQATTARAERRTDDQVALPLQRARDHQVRNVRARDEHHQRDHGDEDSGHRRQEFGDARIGTGAVLGDDQDARSLVLGGIRCRQTLCRHLQLGAGVRHGPPRHQTAHQPEHRRAAVVTQFVAAMHQRAHGTRRYPSADRHRPRQSRERLGRDAHDRERLPVERDRLSDNRWITAEAALPVAIRQHHRGDGPLRLALAWREQLTDGRGHVRQGEVVGRDHFNPRALRGLSPRAQMHGGRRERDEVRQRGDGFPVVQVIRERVAVRDIDDLASLHDHHEFVGVLHGQRLQEQGADDAEDAGVDADAQGKREHRDRGESRLLANGTECLAEIVEHGSALRGP